MAETNKILAILDNYLHDNPDEIAKEIAAEFRLRRIEKNLTREQVAEKSGCCEQYCEIRTERTHITQKSHRHCYGNGIYFRNSAYLLTAEVLHNGRTARD